MFKPTLFLTIFLMCSAVKVTAHPHTWINLQTTFVVNESFELTEIKQQWQFDEYYSAMFISDMYADYGPDQDMAFRLAGENMTDSLASYQYFSNLLVDKTPISIGRPTDFQLSSIAIDGADILTMTMTFNVKLMPNIKNNEVVWSVYDPTYYVAMEHNELANLAIENGNSPGCQIELDIPKPSEETIAFASSLDKTQTETQGLGILFAETIRFNCL